MMEDPLFDPWGPAGNDEPKAPRVAPAQDERSSRWRSPGAAQGVPLSRPVPEPLRPRAVAAEPVEEEGPVEEDAVAESPRPGPDEWRLTPAPVPAPTQAGGDSPAPAVLREVVLPRLHHFAERLRAARHRALIDDRTSGPTPALRFQLRPWRGPFDGDDPGTGPSLEIIVDAEQHEGAVTARVWLDPMAPMATERIDIPAGQLSEGRVDALILDFIERALRDHGRHAR